MVKVKAKTKESVQSIVEAPSDSKHSDSAKRSSPEAEDSPAPVAIPSTEASIVTEAVARPSAKKCRLQQQLKLVERQVPQHVPV